MTIPIYLVSQEGPLATATAHASVVHTRLYPPHDYTHTLGMFMRGHERGQFTTHIGLSHKTYDRKAVEKLTLFKKFRPSGKEEARMGWSNDDRGPYKASRKQYIGWLQTVGSIKL